MSKKKLVKHLAGIERGQGVLWGVEEATASPTPTRS